MKYHSKFNQKISKNHEETTKIKKKLRTSIWTLQGLQEGQRAQKEVGPKILGAPRDSLWGPKIIRKRKKWSPKIDEKSEGFKRASQSRFRAIWGGQKLQNEVKNDSEMSLGSEKTDFCKSAYFIGPADAGRLSRS